MDDISFEYFYEHYRKRKLKKLFRFMFGISDFQLPPSDIYSICIFGDILESNFVRSFDVLTISSRGNIDEKVIRPKFKEEYEESYESEYTYYFTGGPETKRVWIPKKVVKFAPVSSNVGANPNLHIVYRSLDQFLEEIDKNDEVREDVLKRVIPIIGISSFNEITSRLVGNREKNYDLKWSENPYKGELEGKLSLIYKN